ncbi:MAG: hypothetical protein GEV10_22090 [Streptosporangiales bacterium]|nr:hypothetical protein [Streptosporangiales bacterium]
MTGVSVEPRLHRRLVTDIDRVTSRGIGGDALLTRVVETLGHGMHVTGACWQLTDPGSALPISHAAVGHPPGDLETSLHYEFERDDVSRYADIVQRARPLAVLSQETHGIPEASARFREMIAPEGAADELRVAFTDPSGTWALMVLFAGHRFTADQARLVGAVVPTVARGLRLADVPLDRGEPATDSPAAPAVAVLDGADRIEAADPRARELLDALGRPSGGQLPGSLSILAALARRRDPTRPARARTRDATGAWLMVDVSCLDDEPRGRLAVVVQPAPAAHAVDATLRAHGLTAREREVTALAIKGHSNKEIAAALHLSPYTVGDHLKAVFEKTGVSSRAQLTSHAMALVRRT